MSGAGAGYESDGAGRRSNAKRLLGRSRMWQTVGSSSESGSEGEEGGAASPRAKRKRADSAEASSSSGSGSDSYDSDSGSDSESSGSESSDSDDGRRHKKHKSKHKKEKHKHKSSKHKKHKKHKKDRKHKSSKSSKHRKHKKGKKDKKDKKDKHRSSSSSSSSSSSAAVNQNEFGRYGILRESDYYKKQRDFEVWLMEVKKLDNVGGGKRETMEYFAEYCEDYNTVTLPHIKYYDVEKYEMAEHKKAQAKASKAAGGGRSAFDDENERRRELLEARKAREQKDFALIMQTMDANKIAVMKNREHLLASMQSNYKAGNIKEARRIEALLKPDEDEETMKYMHRAGTAETAYTERRNAD